MNKHKAYVGQLSKKEQKAIRIALMEALLELGLREEELKQTVRDGMDSRVCDLADTINLKDILNY
ncbi:hypothetical protein DH09_00775 (plasmid) [Bacillaceae bacterium JMAK1]|nr:hypothetical protein DH09_00775 [Bacillaceae bacterium JMAK1]